MSETYPLRERVTRLLRRVDAADMVLLAAVFGDLAVLLPAALDGWGTPLLDLVPLPGILLLSACAVQGKSRPVFAGWAGACVLGANSLLIAYSDAPTYSTLLPQTSFAECVAGLLLVYYCARSAPAAAATLTIGALVASELASTIARDAGMHILQLSGIGLALLLVAVVPGARARQGVKEGALGSLLRKQWLLVGVLALAVFLDASIVLSGPGRDVVMLLPAAVAVVLVLRGVDRPFRHAFGLAGIIAVTTVLALLTHADRYVSLGGLPVAVTASGMVVTALLVRLEPTRRAVAAIATLTAAVAVATTVQVMAFIQPIGPFDRRFPLLQSLTIAATLLLGMSIAIGLFLRARDSERKTTVEAAVTEAQTAERMALARELHDVVAHHVTGIVVQAQAVRIVAEQNPHVVADSLGQIENAGTEALAAMRRLVRSMRGEAGDAGTGEQSGPGEQATTDLDADLRKLATSAVHGVPVQLDVDVPPGLPQEVARSALRIVQEALTNVSKHASGAAAAWVSVRGENGDPTSGDGSGRLHIRVADDGGPGDPGPLAAVGGYGLVGMRERVELLGGTLTAGRDGERGDGWVVEAWLPLQGDEETQ